MKNKLFIKIGTSVLAIAMLFTLAACGSSDEDEQEQTEAAVSVAVTDEADTDEDRDEETSSLIGAWKSKPDENGVYYDAVVTDDDKITLYRLTGNSVIDTETDEAENDTDTNDVAIDTDTEEAEDNEDRIEHISSDTEVFWVGSYAEPDSNASMSGFTSKRDEDAEMTCSADSLRFTYYADKDEMYFSYEDEDGNDVGVYLTYMPEGVVFDTEDTVYADNAVDGETEAEDAEDVSADGEPISSEDTDNSEENNAELSENDAENASESADESSVSVAQNAVSDTSASASKDSTSDSAGSAGSGSSTVATSSNTKSTETSSNTSSSSSCVHSYGIGDVTVKATCTTAGMRTYTCSKCGATRTETIPATGHNYESTVTKQATCGANGVRAYKCTTCGDSYTTTINATGNHTWENVYKTVHHDATGHYETQKTGMYKCNYSGCGELFATVTEVFNHINSAHDGHASYSATTVETQVWVQDSAAYDEQVVDCQRCKVCGTTK